MFTPNGQQRTIDPDNARSLLRRLAGLAQLRARLYDRNGMMIADSRACCKDRAARFRCSTCRRRRAWSTGCSSASTTPPSAASPTSATCRPIANRATRRRRLPGSRQQALETGEADAAVRLREDDGETILSVAVPVQFYKQVVGVVLVSRDGRVVDQRLFAVRQSILGMFAWVLGVTVLTSLYLAGTIARPVRRLALAAMKVRHSKSRRDTIPDLTNRSDEIGELSAALRDMTESLWNRMDAIEQFAADVAHEIKNPLTSLRSAVETVARIQNPEHQKRLMSIILDDVARLDRLITEISDASRLDAELSRAEMGPVDIRPLVDALAEVQNANDDRRRAACADRRRRPATTNSRSPGPRGPPRPGVPQPDRQCRVLQSAGRHHHDHHRFARRPARSMPPSRIKGPVFRPARSARSSTASTASGRKARSSAPIPASAFPSPNRSSKPIAARSTPRTSSTSAGAGFIGARFVGAVAGGRLAAD